jgi:PKD repeat protein
MRSIRLLAAATSILVLGSGCGGDGGGVEPGTAPIASFTAPTCTTGVACTFTSTSTDADGTITTQVWEFGDGNTGSGATASNIFAEAKAYSVKLTVTDNSGLTGSVTNQVTVTAGSNPPPVASFTLPSDCTAGTPCGFQSTSTDVGGTIENTDWDFGDGKTGQGVNATHTYDAAGSYNVKLTVTDNGGAVGTVTQALTVAPAASQDCTTDGTVVNCSLTVTQRSKVKFTVVSRSCELSGNSLRLTAPRDQSVFFNLCNRTVGEEYVVKDAAGADLVIEAGTALAIRFNQGVKGPNDPPTGDPGIQVSGTPGNWTLNIDDGGAAGTAGEPDFNDAVVSVTTTAP